MRSAFQPFTAKTTNPEQPPVDELAELMTAGREMLRKESATRFAEADLDLTDADLDAILIAVASAIFFDDIQSDDWKPTPDVTIAGRGGIVTLDMTEARPPANEEERQAAIAAMNRFIAGEEPRAPVVKFEPIIKIDREAGEVSVLPPEGEQA